ncbi:unnamed protein product [Moneuplotes crassus]|uniref:Uncharacterized protein n=1 Tax=Euplotes crassus TaxID=5936 RepID=A0AAD1XGR9_EUPCR|nr:unnamed protein product [Moneuplotes crassus]
MNILLLSQVVINLLNRGRSVSLNTQVNHCNKQTPVRKKRKRKKPRTVRNNRGRRKKEEAIWNETSP